MLLPTAASSGKTAILTGRLRDGYGTAVDRAQFTFEAPGGRASGETDSLGRFQILAPVGVGTLSATWALQPAADSVGAPVFNPVRTPPTWNYAAPLAVSEDTTLDLVLPPVVELTVRVTEVDGRPVRDARVSMNRDSVAAFVQFLAEPGVGSCGTWGDTDSLGLLRMVVFPEAKVRELHAQHAPPFPWALPRDAWLRDFTALQDTTVTLMLPPVQTTAVAPLENPRLSLSFANPVWKPMTFVFGLPWDSHVELRIFDLQGRLVARPIDAFLPAGQSHRTWDLSGPGGPLPSGVYLLLLEQGDSRLTKRLQLLR